MDRRKFVLALIASTGSALGSAPSFAGHRRHDAVESAAHLLASARLALRGSGRYSQGLTVEIASEPVILIRKTARRLARHDSKLVIRGLMGSLELSFTSSPWRKLERNLRRLEERLERTLHRRETRHFFDHWHHHSHWTTLETREHLDSCGSCRSCYHDLVHGTDLELIPIVFSEAVTVFSHASGAKPVKELHLPELPRNVRATLDGKVLQLQASVDSHGRAEVVSVDSSDFSSFVVQRAIDMVESNPWYPGRDFDGYSSRRDVRIQFRW